MVMVIQIVTILCGVTGACFGAIQGGVGPGYKKIREFISNWGKPPFLQNHLWVSGSHSVMGVFSGTLFYGCVSAIIGGGVVCIASLLLSMMQ